MVLNKNYQKRIMRIHEPLSRTRACLIHVYHMTSCHKNRMTTRVITLWRLDVTSFTTSVSTMRFLSEIMLILKAIKSHFSGSYDKQNLHSWSFHMKFMKRAFGEFNKFHMKWPRV